MTLPALVATVRSTVAPDPAAVRLVDEKLMHAGYLGIHEPEYLDLYQLRGDAWYRGLLGACGLFLIAIGAVFTVSGARALA